jgi:hypothetical protein
MYTMAEDVGDLRAKVETGNIKELLANAKSLSALTSFLPILYSETCQNEYQISGSKYFL